MDINQNIFDNFLRDLVEEDFAAKMDFRTPEKLRLILLITTQSNPINYNYDYKKEIKQVMKNFREKRK